MHRRWAITAAAVTTLVSTLAAGPATSAPRAIPDRVLLQAEDLGGVQPGPVEDDVAFPLLPQPCAGTPIPQPATSRSLAADYRPRARIYENVARYSRRGAVAAFASLEDQLARCSVGGADNGFRLIAENPIGSDTVLFELNYDEGDRWAAYVAARVDRYVIVVLVTDPVVGAGDPTTANDLAAKAIARATS